MNFDAKTRGPGHYNATYERASAESRSISSTRPQHNPEWVVTKQAEAILPGVEWAARGLDLPIRRLNSECARSPRGCGWLWHVPSLRLIKRIRTSAGLGTVGAIRVFSSFYDGELAEAMLDIGRRK